MSAAPFGLTSQNAPATTVPESHWLSRKWARMNQKEVGRARKNRSESVALFFFVLYGILSLTLNAAPALPRQDPSYTQFGNFLFKLPNGWKPVEKDDAMYILAPGQLSGQSTYIALKGGDLEDNFQGSVNEVWRGFQQAYRILQGGTLAPMHSPKGYDAYYTAATALDQNGVRWIISFVCAQYGKRLEIVTFVSNLPPGSFYDATLQVFQTFLANLSFGDSLPGSNLPPVTQPPPVADTPHPTPAGMLQGVYVCTAGADARPTNKQFIFYPDGFMMYGLPQEGMLDFDFDHYRSQDNKNHNMVGRYRLDGNQVKIVWQNQYGDPANPYAIRINERSAHPAVDLGWEIFIPMCACTGKKFSGTYRWGAPAADQYVQFSPDGTFLDHRVLDQLIIPSSFYEHPRIQRGTYSIQRQTIIFTFADGHRGAQTFLAPKVQENDAMFDWIELGWKQLFEETYRQKLAAER